MSLCPSDQWSCGIFLLALMEVGGVALIVVRQDSSAAMTKEMSEALQALAESETRCWSKANPWFHHWNGCIVIRSIQSWQESQLRPIWGHKNRLKKSPPRSGRQLKLSTSWLRCLGSCQKHLGLTFWAMLLGIFGTVAPTSAESILLYLNLSFNINSVFSCVFPFLTSSVPSCKSWGHCPGWLGNRAEGCGHCSFQSSFCEQHSDDAFVMPCHNISMIY